MAANREQLLTGGDDAGIPFRRAGLDDQGLTVGRCSGSCAGDGLIQAGWRQFPEHVRQHDQIVRSAAVSSVAGRDIGVLPGGSTDGRVRGGLRQLSPECQHLGSASTATAWSMLDQRAVALQSTVPGPAPRSRIERGCQSGRCSRAASRAALTAA